MNWSWITNPATAAKNNFIGFISTLSDSIYDGLVYLMKEMIQLITQVPLIKDIPEIRYVWWMMALLSFSCIGLIFVYLASKNFISTYSIVKTVEMKIVLVRLVYMLIFIGISLSYVDWLIMFNNVAIDFLTSKFDLLKSLDYICSDNFTGNLLASALIIYQMYLAIRIMIGYWLRVAEINLMVVASPPLFTLWINPNWGGFLNEWNRRLVSLIFTNFIQVLVMVLYGTLIMRFFETGTIKSLCLAAANLLLMENVPTFISRFIVPDNAVNIMHKTWNKVTKTSNKVNAIKSKFTRKK